MKKVQSARFIGRALPVLAAVVCLTVAAPRAHADSLLFWDFENQSSSGDISTATGAPQTPGISGYASQTGGGPAEQLGDPGDDSGYWLLTRFFGSNYPFLNFTLARPLYLDSVTFDHQHNHNFGFPTYPSYYAQLQIDTGSGFTDVGSPVLLQDSNVPHYGVTSVALGILLNPGTYQIRWEPRGLNGTDTNTEYFAVDNVSLNGIPTYDWSGVLQPINAGGSSIFKLGSTVPIKFALTGNSAGITSLVATLYVAKVSNNVVGTEEEAISSSPASSGSTFRYDATSGQYIYNWGTKGLSAGTYQLRIDLGDGTTNTVQVSLQ